MVRAYRRSRKTIRRRVVRSRASRVIRKYKAKKLSINTVKRIAKQVVSKEAENKTVQFFSTGANIYPSSAGATFTSSILPVSPYTGGLEIGQGNGQGERTGNRVRLKSLTFKGTIFPLPYNASTNPNPVPVQIVFWFFIRRSEPNTIPTSITGFLQDGDSARNLQNNLSDVMSKVNNNEYRLLTKRVFKIGYAAYEGTGTQAAFQAFHNNDFKLNRNFNIPLMKYAYKNLNYNDNSSNTPRTRGIFLLAQAIAADGSSLPNNVIPARMTYELNCSYEDF